MSKECKKLRRLMITLFIIVTVFVNATAFIVASMIKDDSSNLTNLGSTNAIEFDIYLERGDDDDDPYIDRGDDDDDEEEESYEFIYGRWKRCSETLRVPK